MLIVSYLKFKLQTTKKQGKWVFDNCQPEMRISVEKDFLLW